MWSRNAFGLALLFEVKLLSVRGISPFAAILSRSTFSVVKHVGSDPLIILTINHVFHTYYGFALVTPLCLLSLYQCYISIE